MGLQILNAPTDTLEAAAKRGDGYWILKAYVTVTPPSNPTAGSGYGFTTPIAGLAISPNSEVDIGVCRFNYPNGPGSQLEETEYAFSVGAPLFQRMPPTGIQEGQTAYIDSGRAFEFDGVAPQLVAGWSDTLPYFEVIVYFKQPTISPSTRKPLVKEPVAADIAFDPTSVTRVLAINVFGRRTLSFAALITGENSVAADSDVGTFHLYQGSRILKDPGSVVAHNVFPYTELMNMQVTELSTTPPPGFDQAGSEAPQQRLQWEGDLRGAEILFLVWEPGADAASAGEITPYFFFEARD